MTNEASKPISSDSSDTIALIIEIVFGFFGILGMGWLYAGNISIAVLAFVGFAILVFIEAAIATGTLGLALCLIIPFNLVIAAVSAFRVRDYVRNSGATGSILYLVLGIVIGSIIICGGLTVFFGGLAALGSAVQ